jgi:hypothetical protein
LTLKILDGTSQLTEADTGSSLRIPLVWLRDHCREGANYNHKTNQRKADCTDLFKRAELADDWFVMPNWDFYV